MIYTYANWQDAPEDIWRWPNFSPRELACKGTGALLINEDALDKLQALRERLGRPMLITSAYRSPEHNKRVGGAKNSYHMQGMAFDVRMENQDPHEFEAAARAVGFTGFGYYQRSGFMHIDTGPERSWGTPWPRTSTGLPSEPARQPETLREDKEAQAAAGASVAGTVAVVADYIPAASGFLGELAPAAQIIALVVAAAFLAYILYKRSTK